MGGDKDDITKQDLYDLMGITYDADIKEIKTAYRKKALTCHPDKNPDNPAAAHLFHQLQRALEILADAPAKKAYDIILKARKAAAIRNSQLDSKRRKFKEDLENRERVAEQDRYEDTPAEAAKKLQAEIERLRKEGSRQLEEEVAIIEQQLREEKAKQEKEAETEKTIPRIKVEWKTNKSNSLQSLYTYDTLMSLFSKYGQVTAIVVSKKSRAIVEFGTSNAAEDAVSKETGLEECPMRISWINRPSANIKFVPPVVTDTSKLPNSSSASNDRDYESVVMMKMRQAQERKRLAQEMLDDDK